MLPFSVFKRAAWLGLVVCFHCIVRELQEKEWMGEAAVEHRKEKGGRWAKIEVTLFWLGFGIRGVTLILAFIAVLDQRMIG